MEFLALYSPAQNHVSPDRQEALETLTSKLFDAGVLVACGGLQSDGVGMHLNEHELEGPPRESGYAVFRVESQEELWQHGMPFLDIASDGVCELIRIDTPEATDTAKS